MENSNTEQKTKSDFIKGIDTFVNTTGLKLPQRYLSISQVSAYSLCPRSYYFRYIERIREKASAKLIVGSLGHKVLEMMAEMDQKDFSAEELKNVFKMEFSMESDEVPVERTPEFAQEVEKEMDSLVHSLAYYYRHVFQKTNFLTQEVQVDAPVSITRMDYSYKGTPGIECLGDVTVVGFIDFINHTTRKIPFKERLKGVRYDRTAIVDTDVSALEIGDYKTGSPKDHTFFVGDIQMPFYSYVTDIKNVRIDNILPSRIKINKDGSHRKDNIYPGCNILKYQVDGQDVDNMTQQISAAAVGIGSGSFPMCHPSIWKCSEQNCGYWHMCRGARSKHFQEKVAVNKMSELG